MKTEENMEGHNVPEKRFSTGGINATVWKNQKKGAEGESEYRTISIDRRYKDKEGNWKTSSSLRVNDLPKVALVANKAYEFVVLKGES